MPQLPGQVPRPLLGPASAQMDCDIETCFLVAAGVTALCSSKSQRDLAAAASSMTRPLPSPEQVLGCWTQKHD